MFALGLVNFENFVFTTIALRASLDITKPQAGNTGAAGVGNPTAAGLDPAGALAVLFILVSFFWVLTRMREGRKSPPALDPSHLSDPVHGGGLPQHHRLREPDHQPARGHPGGRGRDDARRARGDARSTARRSRRLIAAIYVSAIVPVGYTIFNVVLHHPQFTSGGFARYEGTFSQPNPFAIYLTMLIVMGAALFPHLTQKRKIGMSILLFLSLVCLYYTFTRSAWIACVVGLFAVAFIGRRRLMLGIMVGSIMVSLVALPSILGRFADLGSSTSAAGYASNSL